MGYAGTAKRSLIVCSIAAWSMLHCWRGLLVYFSNDDIMNMYWAREDSWSRLIVSALVPFTTVYRPSGALLYRGLYSLFGLEPLPFRIVFYLLLSFNLVLVYRLAGGGKVGAVTAFLASFHSRFTDLYLNNGTVYDVLCACFYFAAISYYISVRAWTWRSLLVLYLLATAALNAKEAAATLPIVLLMYELLRRREKWSKLPLGVVTVVMFAGTWARFRPGSRLMNNPLYALDLSLGAGNIAGYLNDLFLLRYGALSVIAGVLILASLFVIATIARSRIMLYWAAFISVSPLPVLFIPHRGLFAYYIAVMGWAVFLAMLLVRLRIPVMVVITLLLVRHSHIRWQEAMPANSKLYQLHRELIATVPKLPPRSCLILLHDPLPSTWTALMLVRLTYNDLELQVIRPKQRGQPVTEDELVTASAVLDYVDGHMIRVFTNRRESSPLHGTAHPS